MGALVWRDLLRGLPFALELWMASPKHRANVLSRSWREIGIAAVSVVAAPGIFAGSDVTIVSTDFGARA